VPAAWTSLGSATDQQHEHSSGTGSVQRQVCVQGPVPQPKLQLTLWPDYRCVDSRPSCSAANKQPNGAGYKAGMQVDQALRQALAGEGRSTGARSLNLGCSVFLLVPALTCRLLQCCKSRRM
jgi:hypothetical protein